MALINTVEKRINLPCRKKVKVPFSSALFQVLFDVYGTVGFISDIIIIYSCSGPATIRINSDWTLF
jgi:hypothetical protein